jgi:glycosyltransferase involved in cell wall biosynthesis
MSLHKSAAKRIRRLKQHLAGHALPLLRKAWPIYGAVDWKPVNQLQRGLKTPGRFVALGTDPYFRLPHLVPAGWYMFEVKLRLPGAWVEARIYTDTGEGESEAGSLPLRLHTERLCKRLVYLPQAARLRFDPLATTGAFTVQHLRMVKVGAAFARKRLQQKLAAKHPLHGGAGAGAVSDEQLWADYCKLFETGSELLPYFDWIEHVERPRVPDLERQRAEAAAWEWKPILSVVIPTWNTDLPMLRACLDSVLNQGYPHWELCIADDASSEPGVRAVLDDYAKRDARVKVHYRAVNGHIVEASNSALALASGEFLVLLDHDDELAPHALFAVARALQERPSAQLLYSDEDKLDIEGARCSPFFKPDFAPDLLYSQNYFSHLGVYRRALVEAVGGFRAGYEGSQDYDLVLRCVARVDDLRDVVHIPEVLYHWRMAEGSTAAGHEQKSYASDAGRRALQDYFDACAMPVTVSVSAPGIYRHQWALPDPAPLVSLIVPTRDGYEVLKTCIDSILEKTTYRNYEILVVDNQSSCPQTLAYLARLAAAGTVRVLPYDQPFNYSAINNFAAAQARGSILGLINNDVEVIGRDWLGEMVSHAVRSDIGCVGAKLYYPNDTIQHAGVICGLGGIANHSHRHFAKSSPGYFGRLWVIHNLSAVTAAVLLVRKEVFDQVGGLDAAGLPVAFNDVDLCLKVARAGYRNLWTPFAELYHHESVSRGSDEAPEKRQRFLGECEVMYGRWAQELARDPYYNPNLTLQREDYSLNAILGA